MNSRDLFLKAMHAALDGDVLEYSEDVMLETWEEFFQIAGEHSVTPMVYESVFPTKGFQSTASAMIPVLKGSVMKSVFGQVVRTDEFMNLYRFLSSKGLEPIVVKGLIVRMLFPNPDARSSSDEDLYIPKGSYEVYKEALAEYGMRIAPWDQEKEDSLHEVTYISPSGALQIEIHKDLFDDKLQAFEGINDLFGDAFEKSILLDIDGLAVRTMNHSDHMLFLILHAFKHFVSSGFGIRQVCDMVVYGNHYGKEIDWQYLLRKSKGIHVEKFAAAIFTIGHRYLGFDYEKSGYSQEWKAISVDSSNLLDDLIDAGVYGAADMSRKHSSNITLGAVVEDRKGGKAKSGKIQSAIKAVCLPVDALSDRFTYLKKLPWLLPLAWVQRVLIYRKETAGNKGGNNAAESLKIGNERVELMREYGIIK